MSTKAVKPEAAIVAVASIEQMRGRLRKKSQLKGRQPGHAARERFEKFWNTKLDDKPGYTVVEIMDKCLVDDTDPHKIRGMYIMGENPAMSDPDLNPARHALCALEQLVVQDIFMTETAWYADVVLPASAWPERTGTVTNTDRMVQMGRRALDPRRKSAAASAGNGWNAIPASPNPCHSDSDPGQPTVFIDSFATDDGRVKLVPADIIPANERPDADYPYVLITGRQLEHWHTGSMTRRAVVLDAIEPVATASMNGAELRKLGLGAGDTVTVRSRRGEVAISIRRDDGTPAAAPGYSREPEEVAV